MKIYIKKVMKYIYIYILGDCMYAAFYKKLSIGKLWEKIIIIKSGPSEND